MAMLRWLAWGEVRQGGPGWTSIVKRRINKLVLVHYILEFQILCGGGWEVLTAGAFVSTVVPLIVFFALQRYFVRGLLAGSVKG